MDYFGADLPYDEREGGLDFSLDNQERERHN
jgi:hypothetical protein